MSFKHPINAELRRLLLQISKPPIISLGPFDAEQPMPADAAWDSLVVISHMIIAGAGRQLSSASGEPLTKVQYEGLWRWSVYLYGEYLRGFRLLRSPEDWSGLFLSIELLFGGSAENKTPPIWNVWTRDRNPALLRLLTDIWKFRMTSTAERTKLLAEGKYVPPLMILIFNRECPSGSIKRWCSTVGIEGGIDGFANTLLGRINDNSRREARGEVDVDVDADAIYAVEMLERLCAEDNACLFAVIRQRGGSTIAKAIQTAVRHLSLSISTENIGKVFNLVSCANGIGTQSIFALKQMLKAHAMTSVLALVREFAFLTDIRLAGVFFLDIIRMNVTHYPILIIACQEMLTAERSPKEAKVKEVQASIVQLFSAVLFRVDQLPSAAPVTLRTFRRQICSYSECKYALKVLLNKISPACFQSLYGSDSSIGHTNVGDESRLFSECGQCGFASYCSEDCHKKDWPVHKELCKTVRLHKEKEGIPPRISKDYDMKIFRAMTLSDMYRSSEPVQSERQQLLNKHRSLSPCLAILELDYSQYKPPPSKPGAITPPFTLCFRQLKDVLAESKYDSERKAKVMYDVLMGGRQLYAVKYQIGDDFNARLIWYIPN